MATDLEATLVDGGITPAAAKAIANAIQNAASAQLSFGRRFGDATPRDKLRMVDANTRKYLLRNIDYSGPRGTPHPYADSQPATAQATLATPAVQGGGYINVTNKPVDSVQQAQIGLNVQDLGGQHARFNPASKAIESVPLSVEIEPKGLLEAEVSEESGRTVIRITLAPDLSEFLQTFKGRRLTQVVETQLTGDNVKLKIADGNIIIDKNRKNGFFVYT
jgi:hypothetical protein